MKAFTKEEQENISPKTALEILKKGNARFVNNLKTNRNLLQQANETRNNQFPFATILSCIDSRTSAELIFDQGLGDIFSIRIAGNIINTDIIGSMEYACKIAGSKLLVVLGHSNCGAVSGACDHIEMGCLTKLLDKMQAAVNQETSTKDESERNSKNRVFAEHVAEINVRLTTKAIIESSEILKTMVLNDEIAIIGGVHNLNSGNVDFFADTMISSETIVSS